MKRVNVIICICLAMLLGIFCTSCSFFKQGNEENNETEKDTEYTFYVYSVDDTFVRNETVIRGEDKYVYFSDNRYTFNGYFTEKDGKGNQITDSTGKVLKDFKAPGSSTAFAIYPYVSALTYTLTFVTNCEEVITPETHTTEEDFSLPEVSKKGYQFVGWSTNPNDWTGLTNVYGGQYRQDTILYAIFRAETYTVIYHKGTGTDYGRIDVAYGEDYTVPYVEETGYNFVGYYTKENGQGQQLTDSEGKSISAWSITENRVVDIYAHYKTAQTYTLTIENNGLVSGINVTYKEWAWKDGQPVDRTVSYRNGEKIAYLSPDVREGYYFDGWYTDYLCRNEYDFTSAEYISDDVVLYAKWVELSSTAPKNILSKATDGSIRLTFGESTSNDMKFFCDFSGTITVNYRVVSFAGEPKTQGAHISILDFDKIVADGESGSVEVTVKKGDILGITGKSIVYGEHPNLVYSFEGFPEIVSQKEVKTPSEFTVVVTKGNHYTLPVYEQSGYIFVGYFSRSDGMGIQLTDEKGNSLSVWNGSNDATVYPYYVKRS